MEPNLWAEDNRDSMATMAHTYPQSHEQLPPLREVSVLSKSRPSGRRLPDALTLLHPQAVPQILSAVSPTEQAELTYQYPRHLSYSAVGLSHLPTSPSFPSPPTSRQSGLSRRPSEANSTLPDVRLRIPDPTRDRHDPHRRITPDSPRYVRI